MAEAQEAQGNLLQSKWGPLPVWTWALIALGAAWAWAKYRASKTAAAASGTTDTTNASEGTQAVAPQFIIEEGGVSTTVNNQAPVPPPSAPITAPGGPPPPISTPPGTAPSPPVRQGGKPPGKPVATGGKPKAKTPIRHVVQPGENLSELAQKYNIPGGNRTGWHELWAYNTNAANRKAAKLPAVRGNDPNLIYPGETILIPQ